MDIIDDIFSTLKLRGALYFRTEFSGRWAATVPAFENAARFHLLVQGRCCITFTDGTAIDMGPGDLVMVPAGASHIISDCKTDDAPVLEKVLEQSGYTGDGLWVMNNEVAGSTTKLVCGHFSFRRGADHPLLRAMPSFIYMAATERARAPLLDEVLRLIPRRIFDEELGSRAAVTRMSEIVYIELLRSGVDSAPAIGLMVDGMRDSQIGAALVLMHQQPESDWTVAALAEAVGMSRSRFAEKFSDHMNEGPMNYLSNWRLQKALVLLEERSLSIKDISRRVGYKSHAAFTRAFAARFGHSPSTFRLTPEPPETLLRPAVKA